MCVFSARHMLNNILDLQKIKKHYLKFLNYVTVVELMRNTISAISLFKIRDDVITTSFIKL